jgi:hypothetical protein
MNAMNVLTLCALIAGGTSGSAIAIDEEPPLVSAIVREVTRRPMPDRLEGGGRTAEVRTTWIARLEILQVFRGDSSLRGQSMTVLTADYQPDGNRRHVVPTLSEGDSGIWAIKQLADGRWAEVYAPYEIEKDIWLPLIKGRDGVHDIVFARLAAGQIQKPVVDFRASEKAREAPPPTIVVRPEPAVEPMSRDGKLTATGSEQRGVSMPRSIIGVLIVAAGGLLWLVLKRRL